MLLKKILVAMAFAVAAVSSAYGQGQFPSGWVQGNPNASAGQALPASVSAILDRALGSTRGAVIERGASGWAIIMPSATVGVPFVGNGTGADPAYQVLGVVGGGTGLNTGTSGGVPCFTSTTGMGSSSLLTQNGVIYGGGAGVCPGAAAAGTNGQLLLGVTGSPPQMATMSQDCTITNAGVITCTKTNNVAFAASATTDTTNASNIGSGTLNTARLPSPFTSGTRQGNTSAFQTFAGSAPTSGHVATFDVNGNIQDGGGATGTVTQVVCGTALTGGTITTTGTCALDGATLASEVKMTVITATGTTNVTPLATTKHIEFGIHGAGGGGAGGGNASGTGGTGGNSTLSIHSGATLATAAGGTGATGSGGSGGLGGAGSGTNCTDARTGGNGITRGGAGATISGGEGGPSPTMGLPGIGAAAGNNGGQAGPANSGAGGGGGSTTATLVGGGGGGGGFCGGLITSSIAASYDFVIGTGGTAGTAGTSGGVGGAGGSGYGWMKEYPY